MKYPINPARECIQMYIESKDDVIKRKIKEANKYADASFIHPYLAEFVQEVFMGFPLLLWT
jgi:hypothetical protein